jgi:hypothetical protein
MVCGPWLIEYSMVFPIGSWSPNRRAAELSVITIEFDNCSAEARSPLTKGNVKNFRNVLNCGDLVSKCRAGAKIKLRDGLGCAVADHPVEGDPVYVFSVVVKFVCRLLKYDILENKHAAY